MRIKITLRELESLLQQQKERVAERIANNSYLYNTTNTPGSSNSLPVDKDKMKKIGMEAPFPEDFNVLKRFVTDDND